MRKYFIPLLIALLLTIGCSGSGNYNPVQPYDSELRIPEFNEGHSSLGMYDIEIDSSSGKIYSTFNRTVSPHYNITSFIEDPACPDSWCLYLWLNNYDPDESIYYLDLYIMNPTGVSPWDPRVIFLTSLFPDDFDIVNADSWTRLFDPDDEFPENVNPFIAMGKDEVAQRRLLPNPYWEMEELWVWINPDKEETSELKYILEVNWPNHCREPYEINNIQFLDDEVDVDYMGKLYTTPEETPFNQFTVACDVWDWQEDVYEVSCYSPSVIGDEDWHLMFPDPYGPPERWFYTSEEINDVDEGYYEFWFRAASDEPTNQVNDLFQRFDFPVYHYDDNGLGGTDHENKDAVVAFLRDTDGWSDIYIKDFAEGGTTYKLVDWPETEEYCPTIGWDGNQAFVVFSSDYLGQIDLWRIDITGNLGSLERLTDDEQGDFGASMNPEYPYNNSTAPEIDLVFYSYRASDSDYAEIYALDLENPDLDDNVTRLTVNQVDDIDPCIFNATAINRTFIAWASNIVAWDNFEIFAMQYIPFDPYWYRLSYDPEDDIHPTWSPGRTLYNSDIVWSSKRNGDFDLYKYEVASSYVLPVLVQDRDQINPCFSPNGNQIIFAWDDDEYFNLWTIPWDGNTDFLFPRTINNKDEWAPSWGWK